MDTSTSSSSFDSVSQDEEIEILNRKKVGTRDDGTPIYSYLVNLDMETEEWWNEEKMQNYQYLIEQFEQEQ